MAGDNCFEAEGLGFLILIVCIWIVGLLGIILSSISINNIRKIKEKPGMKKPNPWFSILMLIIFLLIFIGATIYVSLYIATSKNKDEFMKEMNDEMGKLDVKDARDVKVSKVNEINEKMDRKNYLNRFFSKTAADESVAKFLTPDRGGARQYHTPPTCRRHSNF